MFAPPPQPQSSTLASLFSFRYLSPQSAKERWPMFINETIILPPSPVGLRVLSKNAIALSPYTFFSVIILLDMFLMAGILSSTL